MWTWEPGVLLPRSSGQITHKAHPRYASTACVCVYTCAQVCMCTHTHTAHTHDLHTIFYFYFYFLYFFFLVLMAGGICWDAKTCGPLGPERTIALDAFNHATNPDNASAVSFDIKAALGVQTQVPKQN